MFSAESPAYLQERFDDFKTLIPYLEKELRRKHVTRKLRWEEYRAEHPQGYGYSQFCYHLNQLSAARKGSAVFHHDPAQLEYTVGRASSSMGVLACYKFLLPAYFLLLPRQSFHSGAVLKKLEKNKKLDFHKIFFFPDCPH